jgi:predicted DsbA family dithiol-disulfide isomerase
MEFNTARAVDIRTTGTIETADRVMITYYTDPLCCWSWALESQWRQIKEAYRARIEWTYVMGGMIQDWKSYNDPMNAINRPIQFGPIWMHASQVSGTPMDYSIWHKDPPSSSYPSCIAVKCATIQSREAGELLLYDLREAVMIRSLNISKSEVILSIAEALANRHPDKFDFHSFNASWRDGSGVDAFTADLQKTRFLKIGRFPTMTFTNGTATGIMITGYRPFNVLCEALEQMFDASARKNKNPSV